MASPSFSSFLFIFNDFCHVSLALLGLTPPPSPPPTTTTSFPTPSTTKSPPPLTMTCHALLLTKNHTKPCTNPLKQCIATTSCNIPSPTTLDTTSTRHHHLATTTT